MAFDAPNADKQPWPYVALVIALAYGALPFASPQAALKALRSGHTRTAYFLAALPLAVFPTLVFLNIALYWIAKYAQSA